MAQKKIDFELIYLQIERLQALLHDAEACKFDFSNFEPLPLPLDPDIKVCGIVAEKATLFKVGELINNDSPPPHSSFEFYNSGDLFFMYM